MSQYGDNVMFLLTDHLGSSSIVTDAQGAKIGEVRYKAWGETRYDSGNVPTKQRFTGQREESELGLIYYGARWYDPSIGRFNQADTIIPQPGNALAWDRYSYTMDNPVRYNDPSGHDVGCHGTEASNCKAQTTIGANNIIPPPSKQQVPIAQYNEPELQQTPQPPAQTSISTPYPAQISQPVQTVPVGTPQIPEPITQDDVADVIDTGSDALDFANEMNWIHVPGAVGSLIDVYSQSIRDEGKGYSWWHRRSRELVVAGEGQVISGAASGMALTFAGVSPPVGPGAAYLLTTATLNNIASGYNNKYFFPGCWCNILSVKS